MAILTHDSLSAVAGDIPATEIRTVPEGAAGVAATLAQMVRWARQYRTDMNIRMLAEQIASPFLTGTSKNFYAQAKAVQEYVRDNINYLQDPLDIETLKSPVALLENPYGDCDDKSLLAAALLLSIGHPVKFVAVGFSGPGVYEHVYVETKIGDTWRGVETTEQVPFGWKPQGESARMERNV